MFNLSKTFIIGAAAIFSVSTVSANDSTNVSFRYDQSLSEESNHSAFALTAKRACDGITNLNSYRAVKKCRATLVSEAVEATKIRSFIAYHQNRTDAVRVASAQ